MRTTDWSEKLNTYFCEGNSKVQGWTDQQQQNCSFNLLKTLEKKMALPLLEKTIQRKIGNSLHTEIAFSKRSLHRYSQANENLQKKYKLSSLMNSHHLNKSKIKLKSETNEKMQICIKEESPKIFLRKSDQEQDFKNSKKIVSELNKQKEQIKSQIQGKIKLKRCSKLRNSLNNLKYNKNSEKVMMKATTEQIRLKKVEQVWKEKNEGVKTDCENIFRVNKKKLSIFKDIGEFNKNSFKETIPWHKFNTQSNSPVSKKIKHTKTKKEEIRNAHQQIEYRQQNLESLTSYLQKKQGFNRMNDRSNSEKCLSKIIMMQKLLNKNKLIHSPIHHKSEAIDFGDFHLQSTS